MLTTKELRSSDGDNGTLGGDDSVVNCGPGFVGEISSLIGPFLEPFPPPITVTRPWFFGLEEWMAAFACPKGFGGVDDDDDGDGLRRLGLWAGVPLGFPPSDDRLRANRKETCFLTPPIAGGAL